MNELIRKAAKDVYKDGPLNFGALPEKSWGGNTGGVSYLSSTAGSQVYAANALVSR